MKKGLLKNPIVVAVLIVIAIGFVFTNNIMPYMKSDDIPAEEIREEEGMQQAQIDTPQISELLTVEDIQPVNSITILKSNILKSQGWIRTTSREPFENTRTDTDNEDQADKIKKYDRRNLTDNVNDGSVVNTFVKKPRVKATSLLKAISIGTTEKVALIGSFVCHEGDTCSLGVVTKIDSDSVIIAGSNGIRVLHLK